MIDYNPKNVEQAREMLGKAELLLQGAEARVYLLSYLGKISIAKERFSKKYRVEAVDERLTRRRVNAEHRQLCRCKRFDIAVPEVYYVDKLTSTIIMEYVEGESVKEYLRRQWVEKKEYNDQAQDRCYRLGELVGIMHRNSIIHGDLTTSNVLIRKDTDQLVMIDFGLSSVSSAVEDMGVDLYVLERALNSTHPRSELLFERVMMGYRSGFPKHEKAIERFDEVRQRGRKRTMIG